jgi:hypothetical protein
MKPEPSTLARLVIAYHERFGRHAPESALRHVDTGELAAILEASLATGVPLADTGWAPALRFEFRPGGCIVRDDDLESAMPTKKPDGEWIQ